MKWSLLGNSALNSQPSFDLKYCLCAWIRLWIFHFHHVSGVKLSKQWYRLV